MMRPSNDLPAVYLCRDVVDFRKGINGLAIVVEEALLKDPFSEQLFVFCNRRRDRVKILWVYAEVCGLILAFLGSGGRNAATIFSLRKSSSR